MCGVHVYVYLVPLTCSLVGFEVTTVVVCWPSAIAAAFGVAPVAAAPLAGLAATMRARDILLSAFPSLSTAGFFTVK